MIHTLLRNISTALRTVLDRQIITNATSLYSLQGVNYLVPLVTIPYLARVLGPETWGVVIFVQAIGLYVNMVINYAFDVSASRDVARDRNDPDRLAEILGGVIGARLLLATASIMLIALAQLIIPTLRDVGFLLWLSAFWFLLNGMVPFWYFLGMEQVRTWIIIDLSLRSVAVGAILLLVNGPADAWRFFALHGAASLVGIVVAMYLVYREVEFRRPSFGSAVQSLRDGIHLFLFRASSSVYVQSNTVILGFVSTQLSVGIYGGAERIARVALHTIYPAINAMFPRASRLAKEDPSTAARFARGSMILLFAVGSAVAAITFVLAPWIIRILLGTGYEEAVHVLRILVLLHPITALSSALTMNWMIPMKQESIVTRITVASAFLHIPLAISLGALYAHTGIAWAVVITEFVVLTVLVGIVVAQGVGPFHRGVAVNHPEGEGVR